MPRPSRRSYLALLTGVATAGAAGCVGRSSSSATGAAGTPTGPVRCRGAPVTASETATDAPGYGDGKAYFPANDTVRVVTIRSGGEPAGFANWSFEKWGRIEAAHVAKPRAVSATADRLGTDAFGAGIGPPPDVAATDAVVVWLSLTTGVDHGTVVSTPTTSLGELADRAPRAVETTVSLEGETVSRAVPVYAKEIRAGAGGGVGGNG